MEQQKKRRRMTSFVWDHFEPNEERTMAKCKLCPEQTYLKTVNGSTSSLHNHFRSYHQQKKSDLSVQSELVIVTQLVEENNVDEEISKFAAQDGIAFKTLAFSENFKRQLQSKNCKGYPTSIAGVRNCVLNCYKAKSDIFRAVIKEEMRKGIRLSVSLDEWTSRGKRRYMSVNLHAGDSRFWSLGLIRIKGSLNANNALQTLTEKLFEFGVNFERDIAALVTDGAAVMKKLGKDSQKLHQLCFAHGLHLTVMDTLYKNIPTEDTLEFNSSDDEDSEDENAEFCEEEDEGGISLVEDVRKVISKVRKVVKMFQNSSLKSEKLEHSVKSAGKSTFALVLDCKSRWNSLLDMLGRFNLLEKEIQLACVDLKIPLDISSNEFAAIKEVYNALLPVKVTTESICSRDATLFKSDIAFEWMLKQVEMRGKGQFGSKFLNALKTRITERRYSLSDVYYYLNKGKFSPTKPRLDRSNKKQITETIKKIYESSDYEVQNQAYEQSSSLELDEQLSQPPDESDLKEDFAKVWNAATNSTKLTRMHNVSIALKLKQEMSSFESGGEHGKILTNVFNNLRCIPPSSVESERVFSCAAGFCTKIRSRMRDDTLNALVFLKYYFMRDK